MYLTFLQVFEDGRLTDSFGRKVDFRQYHCDYDLQCGRGTDSQTGLFGI